MPSNETARMLVYSCSGCSNVAQLANRLALRLDHEGIAEMSCIAGVGGQVPALLRKARSGQSILMLDGCALSCGLACLARARVQPDRHVVLSDLGLRKRHGEECSDEEFRQAYRQVLAQVSADAT